MFSQKENREGVQLGTHLVDHRGDEVDTSHSKLAAEALEKKEEDIVVSTNICTELLLAWPAFLVQRPDSRDDLRKPARRGIRNM